MRKQMKEQQAQSDREREQMILDRKNILQEQKKLRQLNQQLLTHVAAFQSNPCNWKATARTAGLPTLYSR